MIDLRRLGLIVVTGATLAMSVANAAPRLIVLHTFNGGAYTGPDGANPSAGLIADASGALYGTASGGGGLGVGEVFKLTPPALGSSRWTETKLHRFNGPDGALPFGTLLADATGALYGTTASGGVHQNGNVFRLTPPGLGQTRWTATVLYTFPAGYLYGTQPGPAGGRPNAGLIEDSSGALYGTTSGGGYFDYMDCAGCGTVFKLTPPAAGQTAWTETVLYAFLGAAHADGADPDCTLIADAAGALYGTTHRGGTAGLGTVFKLSPPAAGQTVWTETVLYSFKKDAGGNSPYAGLLADSTGALYGTAQNGGDLDPSCYEGCGTVFKLEPPAPGGSAWTYTVLHSFGSEPHGGSSPSGSLIADAQGDLYGTAVDSPASAGAGGGIVFKLTPPSAGGSIWTETVLHQFTGGREGAEPSALLLMDSRGNLYGTAYVGGKGFGTVFEITP